MVLPRVDDPLVEQIVQPDEILLTYDHIRISDILLHPEVILQMINPDIRLFLNRLNNPAMHPRYRELQREIRNNLYINTLILEIQCLFGHQEVNQLFARQMNEVMIEMYVTELNNIRAFQPIIDRFCELLADLRNVQWIAVDNVIYLLLG